MTTAHDNVTSNAPRLTGMVKWFNNKAGFGFITVCGSGEHAGKDIFVHFSALRTKLYKYLVQGEYVDFNLVKSDSDNHDYTAQDISGIMGGPIMCETRRIAMSTQNPNGSRPYRSQTSHDADADVVAESDGFQQVESVRRRAPVRKTGPRKMKSDE